MSTRNLIDAIASGSALDIESAFEDTMAEKVSVQIEAKRLQIAQTMFTTEEVDLDEEQLDELSPKTLGSYVKKASKSVSNISAAAGGTDETRYAHWGSLMKKKAAERQKNISKAVNKLVHKANEEVDLDEEEIEEGKWNYPSEYTKKPDAEQREREDVFGSTQKADRKEFRKSAKAKAHKALMTGKLTKEEVEEQSEQE
jgi:hypothetical protein